MPAGATYEPLSSTTLSSTQSSIDFTSISSSYTDLVISLYCQNAAATSGTRTGLLKINSDSGTNYSYLYFMGDGTTVSTTRTSTYSGGIFYGDVPRNGTGANIFGFARISFFNYAGSTQKSVIAECSVDMAGLGGAGGGYVQRTIGLWRSTSAITSISLLAGGEGFASGTRATLYGITKA